MMRRENIDALEAPQGSPIEIEWVDARYLSRWHDRPEILSWERDFNIHRSAGLYVMHNDENLLHAETWSDPGWEHRAIAGINAIPLSSIRRIWRLERTPRVTDDALAEGTMPVHQARELVEAGEPFRPGDTAPFEHLIEPDDELRLLGELALEWRRRDRRREVLYTSRRAAVEQLVAETRFVAQADQALRLALDKRLGS